MAEPLPTLDRVVVMPIVMQAMLDEGVRPLGDPDEVGTGRVVCDRGGVLVGLPVAKEAFGRLGARCRAIVDEGSRVTAGVVVAELGGPLAAIRGAAPLAIRMLERLSAIGSGAAEATVGDPLDDYAAVVRLSSPRPVGDDGPTFRVTIDPGGTFDRGP
jgi:Quinolinate phosphoribosyl transferase, N-terminal domain